jgi:iron complex outermembrane receptor protein
MSLSVKRYLLVTASLIASAHVCSAYAQSTSSGQGALQNSAAVTTSSPDSAPLTTSQGANTPTSIATPGSAVPTSTSAEAPSTTPTQVQEVVVTGSLFRRTNTETPSPVTLLTADQIAKQGIVTISDAIRSVSADNSGTIPNAFGDGFAAGASAVALRGLTAADTLVLIDGLRTADYPIADDGVRNFVDLNTIPIGAVDRVEVLKDGASSIYGSDAVAGVVNIIMKQSFQGFQADASYGDSQHGGGKEVRANALMGHGDLAMDGWNAYIDIEYQNDGKIGAGERGFPFNTNDLSSIGGNNLIGGQPGLNSGSVYGSVAPGVLTTPGNLLSGVATGPTQVLRASGCGVAGKASVDAAGNAYCAQNFENEYDDQPAEERWGIYGRFTKQLGADNQAFVNVYYYENKTNVNLPVQQIQTGVPINTNGIALPPLLSNGALNPNNPFAASGQYALLNYAFGDIPFENTLDNHVIRGTAGMKGEVLGFTYEADVTIAHSSVNTVTNGYINYDQLISDINTGAYSFINPASNSTAVLNALSPTLAKVSTSDLDTFDIHLSRNLFQLPGGPVALAVGGQFRYEAISDPDLNSINADGTPTAGTTLGLGVENALGHRNVGAVFFELDAPVIKPLDVNLSGRYDHYSDFGGNFSPKIGIKYTPFRQLALRATYSQGFRAPSFAQNGTSASEGFITYNPSTAGAPASFINAHNNDGYVQQYSLAEYTVGNTAIQPETSESFTAGFVYEPFRFINVSVDYYHIRQNGIIAQSDPSAVLQDYYAGTALPAGASVTLDNPDPLAPNAPRRVTVVESPFVNANALTTDGLDVDLRANFSLPFGVHYTSDLNATDIFGYEYTAGGNTYNYVGTEAPFILSSGAGTPKYRANWTNTFIWQKLTVTGTGYFTSGIKETGVDATGSSDVMTGCLYGDAAGDPFPRSCHIKNFWDIDLTASYQVTPQLSLYANVLNLTDRSPSLDPANYAGVNYNPTYDQSGIIGRYIRIGAHFKY